MTRFRLLAVIAACGLVLAACGDEPTDEVADLADEATEPAEDEADPAEDEDDPAEDEADPAEDEAAEDDEELEPGGEIVLATGQTDLGEILTDAPGMTVYMFDNDEQGGESTCYDDCEANWPPVVTASQAQADAGVDEGLIGTVERTDGSLQVTYDGWPIYYWAGDEAPGDTQGQGVGDVWWVIAPDGTPIRGDADVGEAGSGGPGYDY